MDRLDNLRRMTRQDLAMLGVQDVAFIKAVPAGGKTSYAVHAADGTEIAVMESREVAFAAVRQHGLEPLSVH